MTCRDVLPLIRDYVDRELSSDDAGRIEAHVSDCRPCAERVEEERDLKLAIRERVKPGPAPAGLADVIARQVRKQSGGDNRAASRPLRGVVLRAAAVTVVAILFGGVGAWTWMNQSAKDERSRAASRLSAELVDDHIRYLSVTDAAEYVTASHEEAEGWFSSKLDVSLVLPNFDARNMTLSGVRLCYVLDRRVALLFYEWESQHLSLFAMSDSGLDFIGMDPVDLLNTECATETYKGYRVVCWKRAGLLYALICGQRNDGLIDLVAETYRQ